MNSVFHTHTHTHTHTDAERQEMVNSNLGQGAWRGPRPNSNDHPRAQFLARGEAHLSVSGEA